MQKKINLKKFFINTKSHEVLSSFFKNYELSDVPFVPETTSPKDRGSILVEFYKNIDDADKKKSIARDISDISLLCSIDGAKILENIFKDNGNIELIMSESLHDIAISYFLNDAKLFLEAKKVFEAYTKTGWQRYPAENRAVEDISEVNKTLKDVFKTIFSNQNSNTSTGEEETIVSVQTTKFEDLYITIVSDENINIYLVYMPTHGEVLVKAKGKKETLYEYAETYMRNMTGESIENKVIAYDITRFIDTENEDNILAPLGNFTGVRSWHMKNIELANNNLKQKIKLTFPALSEKPGSGQMWEMLNELKLKDKLETMQIVKINIMFSLFDENNTDSKINVNLALSSTTSNLNIINKRHRTVDEMLKMAAVNIGFVDLDTEKEK
jgi:hypothetical protein